MDGIKPPEEKIAAARGENAAPAKSDLAKAGKRMPRKPRGGRKGKISPAMGGLLIGTALLFDAVQALVNIAGGLTIVLMPLAVAFSWALDISALGVFALWFWTLGLGMIKKGGLGAGLNQAPFIIIALAFGIELIPFINALPAWTAAVVTVILRERITALAQLAGPGGTGAALGRISSKTEK